MTPRLLLAVACPTCGVAADEGRLLYTGRSSKPRIDRKLCATETGEKQKILRRPIQALTEMLRDSAERVNPDVALIGLERE